MANMGARMRELREKKQLTQEELGNKIGLGKSAIAKYENGRVENIKRSTIEQLSVILECRPSYLMGWDDDTDNDKCFVSGLFPIKKQSLPILGEIACGKPIFCNEDRESYIEIGTNIDADFCLKAKGDSMINARIMDGDIVFIRKQSVVENGEIAAVVIDDEATLKRVYMSDGVCTLQAENPSYAPIVLTGAKLMDVHILGKAIAFQSDVI